MSSIQSESELSTVPQSKITYADLIINYLKQLDVDYVFGIPGGAIEPLYNALNRQVDSDQTSEETTNTGIIPLRQRRSSSGIKPIISRHEAGAAFMADGYARETGKLGVCCATTGPGATNLITGVASAYADRIPMLVITPQTALPSFGKFGMQESSSEMIDTVGMFQHCTVYNTLVSHHEQLEGKLYKALINAYRHPRGPVHLSIPRDILNKTIANTSTCYQVAHLFRQPDIYDEDAYNALLSSIQESKRIVLFLGSACRTAIDDIIKFAETIHAEIVTTPFGKTWVDHYHPLFRGVFGFAGHPSAQKCIRDNSTDLILAVGTSFDELSTSGWDQSLLDSDKLVHIADTPEDFSRSRMAKLHVLSDPKTLFKNLTNDVLFLNIKPQSQSLFEVQKTSGNCADQDYAPNNLELLNNGPCDLTSSPIKPQRLMCELSTLFPEATRFIIDAGNSWAWSIHYLMMRSTGNYRLGYGFSAMGWGIGAAVGTALGIKDEKGTSPTVCITGDGSYLMSGQEISTAVAEKLPVIFIILNDHAYGMIKFGQRMGGAAEIGYELPKVDFAMMAQAVGADSYTIRHPDDFKALDIEKMIHSDRPTLIDVLIDPEEAPPIGARVKSLNMPT